MSEAYLEMEDGVKVISRETIKPSSQTLHPRKLKLSYLDKCFIKIYFPLIFFYEALESTTFSTSSHLQISQRLKQALLQVLPSFYPLAGRRKNNFSVDCNDAGVQFDVARVCARLEDLTCWNWVRLKEYLPAFDHKKRERPLLLVQITFFDCGGVVIAACFSHAVADLTSAMAFLKAWAAACRSEAEIPPPSPLSFGTASFFPSLNFLPFGKAQRDFVSNENFATRRFVFSKEKLDILRSESETGIKDPSRVELVSAFIWKHFMTATHVDRRKCKKVHAALHAVNLRPRTTPSGLLENVFGNCAMLAMAFMSGTISDEDLRLHALIGRVRRSIQKVRDGYITKAMSKESFMKDMLKMGTLMMMGKLEFCCFTSWRGFPTYEVDYGWGKPSWFTSTSMQTKNLTVLISSKSGDDVEAIVTMMPHVLQILDAQIKLISTPNC